MTEIDADRNVTTKISHNVFSALFEFRPRKRNSPKENFLTEALVYTLHSSDLVKRAWVTRLTGGKVKPRTAEIQTRLAHDHDGAKIYPDIAISGIDQLGRTYRVLVEHKWDSSFSEKQFGRYAKLQTPEKSLHLAFVCAKRSDRDEAMRFAESHKIRVPVEVQQWEQIYRLLKEVKPQNSILSEFLQFLDAQGLSPGQPMSASELRDAAERPGDHGNLRKQMKRYCEKLANEYEWDHIPSLYRQNPYILDSHGRSAAIFAEDDGWAPALCLGFLHNPKDHKVPFVDAKKGIDLHIRVQADPKRNPSPKVALSALRARAPALRKLGLTVRLKGDPDNGNPHTLLILQKSLIDVISGARDDAKQIDMIHAELSRWCKVLFAKPRLVKALQNIKPYPN